MTSRPVFERPRLMRTLLCLLIGVLALLWRAVPSLSWTLVPCPAGAHSHCMCVGDVAFWDGDTMGDGRMPSDCAVLYYLRWGYQWCPMGVGWCYGYDTVMRLCTFTQCQTHCVYHTPRFGAYIGTVGLHCNTSKAGWYCHYYNCWVPVFEVQGRELNMSAG